MPLPKIQAHYCAYCGSRVFPLPTEHKTNFPDESHLCPECGPLTHVDVRREAHHA